MTFEIVPILSGMEAMYNSPASAARFQTYLSKLKGDSKDDLVLPIGGFNPMAKAHLTEKLGELKALNAEALVKEALQALNFPDAPPNTIKVVLNLADDLKGGWTNHYATDFDSKFKINALVTRNFCTPYFWSSEIYSQEQIIKRAQTYALRTIYWLTHPKIKTLEDYLNQEIFVCKHLPNPVPMASSTDFSTIKAFFETHKGTDDYALLFNFFYGDAASASLNYPCFGVGKTTGFELASFLATAS